MWQYENKQLKMIRLRLGVTDQTFTEVLNESDVPANAEVVINMTTGLEPRTQPGQNQQNNPLMGPQRGGPGGRGGGPGGGGVVVAAAAAGDSRALNRRIQAGPHRARSE